MRQIIACGLMVIGAVMLSGCLDETTVELHEPGEYKGATDPLVQLSGTSEFSSRLQDRLLQIQTDR